MSAIGPIRRSRSRSRSRRRRDRSITPVRRPRGPPLPCAYCREQRFGWVARDGWFYCAGCWEWWLAAYPDEPVPPPFRVPQTPR
jgi:hypothetical protein